MKLKIVICFCIIESVHLQSFFVSLKMKVVNNWFCLGIAHSIDLISYIYHFSTVIDFSSEKYSLFLFVANVFLSAEALISGTGVGSFLFWISTRRQGC